MRTTMMRGAVLSRGCNEMQSRGVARCRRRRLRSSETGKGLQVSPLFASSSRLGLLRLLLLAVLLLLLQLLALSPASALLQFAEVPHRTTNERTATFTFDCTTLDVAHGDTCEVEVRVRAQTRSSIHGTGCRFCRNREGSYWSRLCRYLVRLPGT